MLPPLRAPSLERLTYALTVAQVIVFGILAAVLVWTMAFDPGRLTRRATGAG